MSARETTRRSSNGFRSIWAALAMAAIYVLLAAGLGNLVTVGLREDQVLPEFALSHFVPLPIAIGAVLLFARRAGWGTQLWKETPTPALRPRRWWLVSIPALAALATVAQVGDVPWGDRTFTFILVIALGTLMIGFGEELLVRGLLLTAIRARHGEFFTMIVTSVTFGALHIPGSLIAGAPLPIIAFQLFGLTTTALTYYWIRRVTGRLWVGMLIHAVTDWALYLASDTGAPGAGVTHPTADPPNSGLEGALGIMLWIALALGVISVIREDLRTRKLGSNP